MELASQHPEINEKSKSLILKDSIISRERERETDIDTERTRQTETERQRQRGREGETERIRGADDREIVAFI